MKLTTKTAKRLKEITTITPDFSKGIPHDANNGDTCLYGEKQAIINFKNELEEIDKKYPDSDVGNIVFRNMIRNLNIEIEFVDKVER